MDGRPGPNKLLSYTSLWPPPATIRVVACGGCVTIRFCLRHHCSPITQKAGAGYADPDYDMSVEWLATKGKIEKAQAEWRKPAEAKALEQAGWDYPNHLAGRTYGLGCLPASA